MMKMINDDFFRISKFLHISYLISKWTRLVKLERELIPTSCCFFHFIFHQNPIQIFRTSFLSFHSTIQQITRSISKWR